MLRRWDASHQEPDEMARHKVGEDQVARKEPQDKESMEGSYAGVDGKGKMKVQQAQLVEVEVVDSQTDCSMVSKPDFSVGYQKMGYGSRVSAMA